MDVDKFIKIYIFEKAKQDGFVNRLNDFNIDAITDKIKSRVIDTICEEVSQLEDWVDFYEDCDSQAQKMNNYFNFMHIDYGKGARK